MLKPQRAHGYRSIWLVGISIGGFGALIHELARPGDVDGIVALAPYLGRRPLGAEIHKAGGLRAWKAPDGPPPDQEIDRKLWPWLQQYADSTSASRHLPPLYLGFGLADRFASNHKLLAEALPSGHVFTTEGGHDWPQWSKLWKKMLDVLPLPALGRAMRATRQRIQWPSRLDVEGIARARLLQRRPAGAWRRPWRSWRRCRCTGAVRGSARARRAWRRPHSVARAGVDWRPRRRPPPGACRPVCVQRGQRFLQQHLDDRGLGRSRQIGLARLQLVAQLAAPGSAPPSSGRQRRSPGRRCAAAGRGSLKAAASPCSASLASQGPPG